MGRRAGRQDISDTSADIDSSAPQPFLGLDVEDLGTAREALEWLWERREVIGRLADELPHLLESAGASLSSAGDGAVSTADLLTGSPDQPGVRGLADTAASTLDRCREELADLGELLTALSARLEKIDIPGVGSAFDSAAKSVGDGAGRIDRIADGLDAVAGSLRALGTKLDDAAGGIHSAGSHLRATGDTLGGLAQRRAARESTDARPRERAGGRTGDRTGGRRRDDAVPSIGSKLSRRRESATPE